MLHTYFRLFKDAKGLPETHLYSLVFSEQFDLDKNRTLTRARLNKGWAI